MLTDSLIIISIFSLPLFVQAYEYRRRFVHVPIKMTWGEAQKYCRANHTDLASFQNQEELQALRNLCTESCWIGLHRDDNNLKEWIWSDGEEVEFESWLPEEPNSLDEKCAGAQKEDWNDLPCTTKIESVCYEDYLILVKEEKTWEEALEYCRTLQTDSTSRNDPLYDLPHMTAENVDLYAEDLILYAQTLEVWIGLRFLPELWFWVDGFPLQKQLEEKLPVCPAPRMNCGTWSITGGVYLRDCAERRNFFCLLKDKLV